MEIGIDYPGITTPFYCNDGKGRFLLHKRSRNTRDEHGAWDPGSGKLEMGADPDKNVLKEVLEEYGCVGIIQEALPAHALRRMDRGRGTFWIAIPHFVLVNPDEVRIGEPDKIDEIGWFTLDQLPQPLHTGFAYTLSQFPGAFQKYGALYE